MKNKKKQTIKQRSNYLLLVVLGAFFAVMLVNNLNSLMELTRLNEKTILSSDFREHILNDEALKQIQNVSEKERGTAAGLFLLDKNHIENVADYFSEENVNSRIKFWEKKDAWNSYLEACEAIWNDVKYFPIPESTTHEKYQVNYVDSWMGERNYGGKRGHEGTDIMASEDRPGLYPVVSMTDGVVESKGWLEQGGYRLGIRAPRGAYFYYAHLDSYSNIEVGDEVSAGDILGFMGNSGYGPEGTTGMFATHLHLGIYLYPDGQETSINPYWILRMSEEKKLSCSY